MVCPHTEKHIYTLKEHLKLLKSISQLSDLKIINILNKCWSSSKIELSNFMSEQERS